MTTSVRSYNWRQAQDDNSTDDSFTAKTPTTTEPSGTGVLDLDGAHRLATSTPETLLVLPYGSDANNEQFDMRVWAWVPDKTGTTIWVPQLLVELAVTLGNISFSDKGTNHFLADTVSETTDASGTTIHTTTDLAAAYAEVPIKGAHKVQFTFNLGTAAAANCLWRFI